MGHVNLVPIDVTIDFIESYSSKKEKIKSHLLNSTDPKERAPQVEMLLGVFKHMAQYSNQNLLGNVDYLFVKENKKVRIWSGVVVRQNNVTIHQNLNLRINSLARDDERERVCFYILMTTFG